MAENDYTYPPISTKNLDPSRFKHMVPDFAPTLQFVAKPLEGGSTAAEIYNLLQFQIQLMRKDRKNKMVRTRTVHPSMTPNIQIPRWDYADQVKTLKASGDQSSGMSIF